MDNATGQELLEGIAIVGMAGRFPGARNLRELWDNLKAGVESVSFFTEEELASAGVDLAEVRRRRNYVPAQALVPDADRFDAAFFDINPKDAELMDPQHRLFLLASWEALEDAGYDPNTYAGAIGVYGGANKDSYFFTNVYPHGAGMQPMGVDQVELANEKDYVVTRVSYKLNLRGPSVNIHSACSTSLVAVAQAYQSLLSYQCDMALAGGVCVRVPQTCGYWYQDTSILSPDGHCRPYDEQAQGTVGGSGVGIVVLKRLSDAQADGDHIYAVIKGMALNNDGSTKLSFSSPSVDGQSEVIAVAQAIAGVSPETITYVEGHGTATPLGDPIEVAALTRAFRRGTDRTNFCALGSIKSNFGHLDTAAGVAGLIKAALAIHHGQIPPTVHFQRPNPKLELEQSPFYVNHQLLEWQPEGLPRRAGVSSFGIGGTNAHAVLEEAPAPEPSGDSRSWQLLTLSARSEAALDETTDRLGDHLRREPTANLADVAYTLHQGRKDFDHRTVAVCRDPEDASAVLTSRDPLRVFRHHRETRNPSVCFMFPGGGAQYVNMGRDLYREEPVFREEVTRCLDLLRQRLNLDLLPVLYPEEGDADGAMAALERPSLGLPSLFAVEYACARLWMSWGVQPQALVGHSMGEYTAACLAGVFSLETALDLVALRGRLFEQLPEGAMLGVPLSEAEVTPYLSQRLSIAAINRPNQCTVSGPVADIEALQQALGDRGIDSTRVLISVAAHSTMVEAITGEFAEFLRGVQLAPPSIPILSNLSGTWLSPDEATNPDYWVQHLRRTVRFSDSLQALFQEPGCLLLEVGPGQTLSTLVRQHPERQPQHQVWPSLRHPRESTHDLAFLLSSLGRLWQAGVSVDWTGFYSGEQRQRVSLPTYPFERTRYWIDPPSTPRRQGNVSGPLIPESVETPTVPEPKPAEVASMTRQIVGPAADARRERIQQELQRIISDFSGIPPADLDVNATFLELGFDSLFLTQANGEFQKQFDVKITFRQLLDEAPTLSALAGYIQGQLPPDFYAEEPEPPVPPPAPEAPATPSFAPATATPVAPPPFPTAPVAAPAGHLAQNGTGLEQLLNQQLQVMAQQLELLRGAPTSNGARPAAPAAVPQALESCACDATPAPKASSREPSRPGAGDPVKPQRFGPWKPIDKSSVEVMTPRQQESLDQLVARYTARTARSKELAQTHRPHHANLQAAQGFRNAWKEMVYPTVSARSSGARFWDIDGNEYIDLTMGFGSVLVGHAPDFVMAALQDQLTRGIEIGPLSPLVGEVAELICRFTGMERAAFCNTGSEAVLAALRVARTVTGRAKVATFVGDYHGMFDEVLVRPTPGGSSQTMPVAPGIPPHMVQDVVLLEYGNPESLEVVRQRGQELAAVVVEPVQSRHPNVQPREFLQQLRKITEEMGIALVFDEVITGFRLAPGGAQEFYGVRSDLACYGKVVGGGMPIGVLAGKSEYMDAVDGGSWSYGDDSYPEVGVTWFSGTFVRHPLAMAAAAAVLRHLQSAGPELQRELNRRADQFAEGINRVFDSRSVPARLQHCGSVLFLEFLDDLPYGSLLYYCLREKGIDIWEGRPMFVSTAHTDEDLGTITRAVREAVAEMQEAGFLPEGPEEPLPDAPPGPRSYSFAPTPSGDEAVAVKNGKGSLVAPGVNDPKAPHNARFPLTESQMEIWLATRLGDDASRAFNESYSIKMSGPLDLTALAQAIQQVADRHDALRITFSPDGSFQQVNSAGATGLQFTDLSDQQPEESRLTDLLVQETNHTFDLVNGPLFRARIFKLADQEHRLHLLAHHIVCDGWSFGVILEEVSRIYSALTEGEELQLDEPMQFAEYAAWQRQTRESPAGKATGEYWLDRFAMPVTALDLPTDHSRGGAEQRRGDRQQLVIDPALLGTLRQLGIARGATLYTTLLAAYQVLLHRLTGQEDQVVGVSMAGQALAGDPALVCHGVNLLPFRSQLDPQQTFVDYLAAIRGLMLDAYEHQDYTFNTLIKQLRLPRDPARVPLVSAIFNLDQKTEGIHFSGLNTRIEVGFKPHTHFDLFFNLEESRDGLTVLCDYSADLFDRETIQRWLGHYRTALQSIVENPDQSVGQLAMMSAEERERLLVEWNQTGADYPSGQCLHQLFQQQAGRTPDAVAVTLADQQLTYLELNQRANRLAHYLQGRGVGTGELVGISLERSLDQMVALLGILKAGASYLPLDPEYPRSRLEFILQDARVNTLIAREGATPGTGTGANLVDPERDSASIARESDSNPASGAGPESPAYVIYTSGSTGQPKGVQVPHRALVNCLSAMGRQPGLTESDVFLSVTSLSFDIAALELFLPLVSGARLALAPRDACQDGYRLQQVMQDCGATVMQATPATWRLLLDTDWPGNPRLTALCGGEVLPSDLAGQLLDRCGTLWNLYGPTEATIWSTAHRVDRNDHPVPIGRPIANTQVYVLDEQGQPAPVGLYGELYLGGDGLALGYLNRPELTAEKFVPDPFRPGEGRRLYRTGDVVRYLPDGTLQFLNRVDTQVKLRGFRIELGEVESVLERHPQVQQAAAMVREDQPGDARLTAYFVSAPGQTPEAGELRSYLQEFLPGYMVPSALVSLPALPLTPNQKVDRQALPAPEPARDRDEDFFSEPSSDLEQTIAGIWRDLLGVERISVYDNFFDLGGHSLLSMQFIAALEKSTGIRLEPREVILQTLGQLASSGEQEALAASSSSGLGGLRRRLFGSVRGRGAA